MEIIDGRKLRGEILKKVKSEVALLPFQPVFCDILVGDDPASAQYVKMKGRTAETVGIHFHQANFPRTITTEELVKEIQILNKIPHMCGIIIQLPLPPHIDRRVVLDAIDPTLDVDCLGTVASEKFYKNPGAEGEIGFPTAFACMALLDSLNINLKGKVIIVLGQGELVGKPVAALLRARNLSYQPVNSKTENKESFIVQADILISGIGKPGFVNGNMIKFGCILIDAGTSESDGGIVGDVDRASVEPVAGYLSPVPGGVGPVTVAILLDNVLKVAKRMK